MPAPGTLIERREQVPPRTPPVSVGTAFMAGISDKGSTTEAVKCTSLGDFVSKFGGRRADSPLYDAVDSFFHEGGSEVWISRVTGPGNAVATVNIFDQAGSVVPGDIALVATAKNGGAWGNSLNVDTTVSGANFQVQVKIGRAHV